MNYGSRKPLHFQNPNFAKGMDDSFKNPSYESFRSNIVHKPQYKEGIDTRATVAPQYRLRRFPNGTLDLKSVGDQVLLAIKQKEFGEPLTPIQESLITILFPEMYREVEPMCAEIRTQLSASEKEQIKAYVVAKIREIDSWASGQGRGATPGASRTDVGG